MSFVDQILGNLRGYGVIYLVCIAAVFGAFKFLVNHPQAKKFTLIGAFLILGSSLLGGLVQAIVYQVMVGSFNTPQYTGTNFNDFNRQMEARAAAMTAWGWVSATLGFVMGLANAGGIASLVWAVFVDKMTVTAKGKKKPGRRRDEDDEDDDDRPRRKRSKREDDEDEDEEEDRPRRRSRRGEDDD